MPVIVPRAGALLRSPEVSRLSVVDGGIAFTNEGPGNTPFGLAGEGCPVNEGAVPPCAPIEPFRMSVLPRNQSNPNALLSLWVISANFASMVICGGDMLRT